MALGIGCTGSPGRSGDNRTGSWRVFIPRFISDKCKKCGLCRTICPEGCVHQGEDEVFRPDYNYCKGCGLCAEECNAGAIEMEQEDK